MEEVMKIAEFFVVIVCSIAKYPTEYENWQCKNSLDCLGRVG